MKHHILFSINKLCVFCALVSSTFTHLTAGDSPLISGDIPQSREIVVSIEAADPGASEHESSTGLIWIMRSGDKSRDLPVALRYSGTAKVDEDFKVRVGRMQPVRPNSPSPQSATIPAGKDRVALLIVPIDDSKHEETEAAVVSIAQALADKPEDNRNTSPAQQRQPYTIGKPDSARVLIADDDFRVLTPPKIALLTPKNGDRVQVDSVVRVTAETADADGRVVSVAFFLGDRLLGTDLQAPFSTEFEAPRPGEYSLRARATDNDGLSSLSEAVKIVVIEKPVNVESAVISVIASDAEAQEPPTLINALPTGSLNFTTNAAGLITIVGSPGTTISFVTNIVGNNLEGMFSFVFSTDPAPGQGALVRPTDTATFTFVRTGNPNVQLKVQYELSGTAANGVDYVKLPGVLEMPAGVRTARVVVVPLPDALREGRESIVLTVIPPACPKIFPPPDWCYNVGKTNRAEARILDDEQRIENLPPVVRLSSPKSGTRYKAPAIVELLAEVVDKDGYPSKVEFYAGEKLIATRTLNFVQAPKPGGEYKFEARWTNTVPGVYKLWAKAFDNNNASASSAGVEVIITANVPTELPTLTLSALDPEAAEAPGAEAANTASFRVTRNGDLTKALKMYYRLSGSASNRLDYEELDGDATIAAGSATRDIIVRAKADQLKEEIETVVMNLAAHESYKVGTPAEAVVKILDAASPPPTDKPATLVLSAPADGATFAAPATIELKATAVDPASYISRVEFLDGDRIIGVSELVFIRAPDPGTPIDHAITWKDAAVGSHRISARAKTAAGVTVSSRGAGIRVTEASNPNQAVVSISGATFVGFEEGSVPAFLKVTRTGTTEAALKVYYRISGTASNGVDYAKLTGELLIPAGTNAAYIEIKPITDTSTEFIESAIITIEPPVCVLIFPPPPECYLLGSQKSATGYIVDGGLPPIPIPGVAGLTQAVTDDLNAGVVSAENRDDGSCLVGIAGESGLTVIVQSSSDLTAWHNLGEVTLQGGYAEVVDVTGAEAKRYYRVVRILETATQ